MAVATEGIADLTEGEAECLRLVAQGFSSKEIARMLPDGISQHTVDQRLRQVLRKLGVATRKDAARLLAADAQGALYQSLIYQPDPIAQPAISAKSEEPAETVQVRNEPRWAWVRLVLRVIKWLAQKIGGPRHDLSKQETILAILWTALVTMGILACILTVGYWLNDIFR